MMKTEASESGFAIHRLNPVSGAMSEIHFAVGQSVKVFLGSGVGYSALAAGEIEEVARETREFRLAGETRWHAWANAYPVDYDNTPAARHEIEVRMTRIQSLLDQGVTTQIYEQLFWARRLADVIGVTDEIKMRLFALQDHFHDLVAAKTLHSAHLPDAEATYRRATKSGAERAMSITC